MANLTKCSSCDGCQGCNVCQSCDSCQAYCQSNQNSNNGFTFDACIATGQMICNNSAGFNRDDWNSAIKKINSVFNKGIAPASSSNISESTATYLTAAEFKRVAKAVSYANYDTEIQQGGVIYGSYFSKLQTAVANLNYKSNQCSKCNSGCQTCVNCNSGCNAGAQKKTEEYCCSCVTAQGSTGTE